MQKRQLAEEKQIEVSFQVGKDDHLKKCKI